MMALIIFANTRTGKLIFLSWLRIAKIAGGTLGFVSFAYFRRFKRRGTFVSAIIPSAYEIFRPQQHSIPPYFSGVSSFALLPRLLFAFHISPGPEKYLTASLKLWRFFFFNNEPPKIALGLG